MIEGSDEGGNRMYTIKAGALVRIKVEMVADGMRSYVALVVSKTTVERQGGREAARKSEGGGGREGGKEICREEKRLHQLIFLLSLSLLLLFVSVFLGSFARRT